MKRLLAAPALLFVLFAGCSTFLPDVQPFATATAKVNDGLKQVGKLTVERLANGEAVTKPSEGEKGSKAWQFKQAWNARLFAAQSLVDYSTALAEITAAGAGAGEAAKKLGDTIEGIANLIPGAGPLPGAAVQLGEALVKYAVQIRASKSVADAVAKADPAVGEIAKILEFDFEQVWLLYDAGYNDVVRARYTRVAESGLNEYQKVRKYRDKVKEQVDTLRDSPDIENEEWRGKLKRAEEFLERAENSFKPHWETRLALGREREAFQDLLTSTEEAVGAWRRAHKGLAASIRAGRQPNFMVLVGQAEELYGLVKAVRAEQKKANAPTAGTK